MDMQDNLLFIHHQGNDGSDVIDLDKIKANDIIFSFNEYETIDITLKSSNLNVKLECLSYKDFNGKFHWCNDNELYLENEISYIISASGDEVCYSPSKYQISIRSKDSIKICYFEVRHNKEVTNSGIENVIEKINKFIDGLTIDFFRNMPINSINVNEAKSWYIILEILVKEEASLKCNSEFVSKKIKSNISTKIKPTRYEGRQNLRSIRKNIIHNGKDKTYSVVKVLDYNNNDNILLKKYIIRILEAINGIDEQIASIIDTKEKQLNSLKVELSSINIDEGNNLSKFSQRESIGHKKNIYSEIDELNKWILKLREWQIGYKRAVFNLNRILLSDEMKGVNVSNRVQYSSKFMMNHSYRYFYDFYELISSKRKNDSKGKNALFTDKRTYSLFEIYGFIVLQNIIKELGFSYSDNMKATLFNFASGKSFIYNKDQYKIEVQYDYYCKKYDEADYDEVVNVNSYSNKPDYIIKIYENDRIKSILILEIKYRNIKNMSKIGTITETDATINDYSQLRYNMKDCVRPRALVDDVFVLYPSKEEQIIEKPLGCYVGINVDEEFSNSRGYLFIKDAIERYTFE